MTPKCPTFHQQRTRSADASNFADVETSIKRRQSDGHPLITILRGVHEQTNRKQHATAKLLWQHWLSPALPGHPRAQGAEAAPTCRTFPRSPWIFRVTPPSVF